VDFVADIAVTVKRRRAAVVYIMVVFSFYKKIVGDFFNVANGK
jgi:hypothetical protein